jgi:polyhydroxyalkanoate synthesis regulator phasin
MSMVKNKFPSLLRRGESERGVIYTNQATEIVKNILRQAKISFKVEEHIKLPRDIKMAVQARLNQAKSVAA